LNIPCYDLLFDNKSKNVYSLAASNSKLNLTDIPLLEHDEIVWMFIQLEAAHVGRSFSYQGVVLIIGFLSKKFVGLRSKLDDTVGMIG